MVLQNTAVVLIGRYTRDSKSFEDLYVVNHLIIVCELVKFFASLILEYRGTEGKLIQSLKENILDNPIDCLKIMIPSMLYLFQNTLLYVALSNLTAPVFQVTYQTKLLTTAVVSVVLLQRKYSLKQWICLATLGLGVAIVVLGEKKAEESEDEVEIETDKPVQNLSAGLISVTVACLSSAFAGVYFEKVLKTPTNSEKNSKQPASLWMRNIQMAFFSVLIAFVQSNSMKNKNDHKAFCHGFTGWVWLLVSLQAGGGLLVAAIIKYADNVLKGMATGVSVVTGTLLSTMLFGTSLDAQFILGSFMILTSVYLFSNAIPCKRKSTRERSRSESDEEVEMQKPLVESTNAEK